MSETSSAPKSCQKCGATLPVEATAGLCPACLMADVMAPTDADTKPAASQKAIPPAELAPHFPQLEVLEYLGRGGMGVVYKARQKNLDRLVALKLLAPERIGDSVFAERFTHEARALAALNHPNIVTVHDFGQAGGFYYLLMEFVDGVNLRQAMKAARFTPEQALTIVPPVCEALEYAHAHGIAHRDIKPENLLLDKEGRVKIADFGIAKMLEGRDAALRRPDDGERTAQRTVPANISETAGTPQYMAPEQKTHRPADHRADIYSLGVVLYELLTGELPGRPIEPPSRKVVMDVRLDAVVLRALEANPERRYQTAAEIKTQVEIITNSLSPAGTGVPPVAAVSRPKENMSEPKQPKPGSHKTLFMAIVCAAVLVFGGVLWWTVAGKRATFQAAMDARTKCAIAMEEAVKDPNKLTRWGLDKVGARAKEKREAAGILFGKEEYAKSAAAYNAAARFFTSLNQEFVEKTAKAASRLDRARMFVQLSAAGPAYERAAREAGDMEIRASSFMQAGEPERALTELEKAAAALEKIAPAAPATLEQTAEARNQMIALRNGLKTTDPIDAPAQTVKISAGGKPGLAETIGRGRSLEKFGDEALEDKDCANARAAYVAARKYYQQALDVQAKLGAALAAKQDADAACQAASAVFRTEARPALFIRSQADVKEAGEAMSQEDFARAKKLFARASEGYKAAQAEAKKLNLVEDARTAWTQQLAATDTVLIERHAANNFAKVKEQAATAASLAVKEPEQAARLFASATAQLNDLIAQSSELAWSGAINLMPLIDPQRDSVHGAWRHNGSTLLSGSGRYERIKIPYEPPDEYDFRIAFVRTDGHDSIYQCVSQAGRALAWAMGGGGNKIFGFTVVNGQNATHNESYVQSGGYLTNGCVTISVVQVRRDGVKAYVNGRLITELKTDYSNVRLPRAMEMPDYRGLGLGTYVSPTVFQKIELREVTGKGRLVIQPVSGTNKGPADDPAWARAINLMPLIDPDKDAINGRWRKVDDTLISGSGTFTRIQIPYEPPDEYDFRITFVRNSGKGDVKQIVSRLGNAMAWSMGVGNNKLFGFGVVRGKNVDQNATTVESEACLTNGRVTTSIVQVRKHGVKAYVDGKLISEMETDFSNLTLSRSWEMPNHRFLGVGSYGSITEFQKIELLEITGKGKAIQ
jgi:tRNA A-37 threonylcarbamoyl transferase component Bud32